MTKPDGTWPDQTGQAAVTIYDVAARAGVSIATVSHALNRPDRVAEETRRRVLATADELGFRRRGRGAARTTAAKRIAVVGPLSRHATYLQRLLGIIRQAEADFTDVIAIDDQGGSDAPVLTSLPLRSRVDGVIIMGAEPNEEIAQHLASRRVATVLLDRASDRFSSVTVDDQAGGRLIAEHLLGLGVASAVIVSPPPVDAALVTSGELKIRGFSQAFRQAGLGGGLTWAVNDDTFEGGREAARELAAGTLPGAVFGLHDRVAAGVWAEFTRLGIRVPADTRIVGYDDIDLAAHIGLTTIRQPFVQSGAVAFDTLRTQILDPDRPLAQITLLPALVVRASTDPADTEEPGHD